MYLKFASGKYVLKFKEKNTRSNMYIYKTMKYQIIIYENRTQCKEFRLRSLLFFFFRYILYVQVVPYKIITLQSHVKFNYLLQL